LLILPSSDQFLDFCGRQSLLAGAGPERVAVRATWVVDQSVQLRDRDFRDHSKGRKAALARFQVRPHERRRIERAL